MPRFYTARYFHHEKQLWKWMLPYDRKYRAVQWLGSLLIWSFLFFQFDLWQSSDLFISAKVDLFAIISRIASDAIRNKYSPEWKSLDLIRRDIILARNGYFSDLKIILIYSDCSVKCQSVISVIPIIEGPFTRIRHGTVTCSLSSSVSVKEVSLLYF